MNVLAYYNEIDPFAAQWLRNLIAAGHIAPGDVDERSIIDVRADDLRGYTQCHFFAGIGGWSYALRLAGWPDERPVWTGSCPCQPFSLAGKRKGFDDERHLWPIWRELIRQCDPTIVFGEQVASATDWLRLVRSDLEAMDRAVGAIPFQAASAGAEHLRDRYGFVAYANHAGPQGWQLLPECAAERIAGADGLAHTDSLRRQIHQNARGRTQGSSAREIAGPLGAGDGDVANSMRDGARDTARNGDSAQTAPVGGNRDAPRACVAPRIHGSGDVADSPSERQHRGESPAGANGWDCSQDSGLEWVIGADGKARRVKPGIRLLAHGVPNRVGLLRGFGNAIDPRAFKQFILASQEAIGEMK